MFKQNDNYEVLTPSGWQPFAGIQTVMKKGIATVILHDGEILDCSLDHAIENSNKSFEKVRDLEPGRTIRTIGGPKTINYIHKDEHKEELLYDLVEVGGNHSYFTNGFVSHNCQFLGGSNTLVTAGCLQRLMWQEDYEEKYDGLMKIYEEPKKNSVYLMSVDVSEGVSQDYSTIQIIDITEMPFKQVATYRNNKVSPLIFPGIIHQLGTWYNKAWALVENNSVGTGVVSDLFYDFEYENVLFVKTDDEVKSRLGIRVSSTTKKIGCLRLKDIIESDSLILQDEKTINELYTFTEKKDSYAAEDGLHDDMVMPLVNFAYYSTLPYFVDLTDNSFKDKFRRSREMEIESSLPPVPFFDDGTTDLDMYGSDARPTSDEWYSRDPGLYS